MTDWQLFYRLVARGVIEMDERQYNRTVVRFVGLMRLAKEIPFAWIADNTRWMRKPTSDSSMEQGLAERRNVTAVRSGTAKCLRRDLAGERRSRGCALRRDVSLGCSFDGDKGLRKSVFSCIQPQSRLRGSKPTFIYYFGDHDPSGLDIRDTIEARLRQFAPEAELHFIRVAVTPEQIESMALPTRPTKKSDSPSRNFEGESVEVDAIEPAVLRQWLRPASLSISTHTY